MGSLGTILSGVLKFVLQIFLQGLFKQVLTQIEDEAQAKVDAGKLHEESVQESANTEVKISQDQAAVDHKYDTQKPDPEDPFHVDGWNAKK